MTTEQLIKGTEAYRDASPALQQMAVSQSNIGLIENALEWKGVWSYEQWENETCAGSFYKAVVKELYA